MVVAAPSNLRRAPVAEATNAAPSGADSGAKGTHRTSSQRCKPTDQGTASRHQLCADRAALVTAFLGIRCSPATAARVKPRTQLRTAFLPQPSHQALGNICKHLVARLGIEL